MLRWRDHPRLQREIDRRLAAFDARVISLAREAQAVDLSRELRPDALAFDQDVVTQRLFDRLDEADVAEIERRISQVPELEAHRHMMAVPAARRWLLLSFGIWLGVPGIAERTGLGSALPPADVHAMTRGPAAAAGGLYEADMVACALLSAGVEPDGVRRGLDFGCSSGRVVRVLAAVYPEASWSGCDPNAGAIAWAREHLPAIDFLQSGDVPPLPLADGALDLVYAISVWSHFEPELGLRWFDEMRRVLAPGGHLVFTTHGLTSLAVHLEAAQRTPAQSAEIERALYSRGTWYAAEFGAEGDWGVTNALWGTAFLSPEWLLGRLCPRWRVLEFAAGRNHENQDLYVLERV